MTLIRTLHWDSDPSTLQLHSDSELGYWTLSSLLSWSFSFLSIYGMITLSIKFIVQLRQSRKSVKSFMHEWSV